MAKFSFFRGHKIVYDTKANEWFYDDTGEPAGFNHKLRPCKKCGKEFQGSNEGDPDPCLGNLPGVDNACCGHGEESMSYIRFTNGIIVKGFKVE